jgi:hypothetical protein
MTRKKKSTVPLVRSSAAEYLTFVAASGTGGVEAVYADENVWLSQKMMAQLYDVEVPTINYHLKKVFDDSELEEDAVVRNFRITAADGKTYDTKHARAEGWRALGNDFEIAQVARKADRGPMTRFTPDVTGALNTGEGPARQGRHREGAGPAATFRPPPCDHSPFGR